MYNYSSLQIYYVCGLFDDIDWMRIFWLRAKFSISYLRKYAQKSLLDYHMKINLQLMIWIIDQL